MKKIFFYFCVVGIFLLGGSTYASVRSETSSISEPEVVTLTFEFYQGPEGFMYYCRDVNLYDIEMIDMWIHNVDLDKNGNAGSGVTAWIQLQGGADYSEVVPGTLTPHSYVDLNTIQVRTRNSRDYIFQYNIIGVPPTR